MARKSIKSNIPLNDDGLPDPDVLLEIAEQEPPVVRVSMYWKPICALREKGYSWNEVSEWLARAGVDLHAKKISRYAAEVAANGGNQHPDKTD
jgi:hypothetical protein